MADGKVTTEIGSVETLITKLKMSVERLPNGDQNVIIAIHEKDGRCGVGWISIPRRAFAALKRLVDKVDAELANVPVLCDNCKVRIPEPDDYMESKGSCPFCGHTKRKLPFF